MSQNRECAMGSDMAVLTIQNPVGEYMSPVPPGEYIKTTENWHVAWICDKWHKSEDHDLGLPPNERVVATENLLVTGGINLMLLHLIGDTNITAYTSGSANIKVGNSTTAAASGDTDILGGSNAESAMDAGYPTVVLTTATWRSTFGSSAANFAWEEVAVKNASGAVSNSVRILNRKVQSFGTKVSGATWTMTLQITIT
jgi:hypothetical protein